MFYVYVYKDPRPSKNLAAIYVGKGTGRRAWQHWEGPTAKNPGLGAVFSKLRQMQLEPIIEIICEFNDEAEAFMEEMRLIELYGRRDLGTGTLFNLTDGGEGFANVLRTEEWKAKISESMSTPEKRSFYSEGQKRRWADPEKRAATIAAIREALKDPEVIRRREAGKEAFVHTEEFRQTMSAATTKLWADPAYAEKVIAGQVAAQNTPEAASIKSANSKALWAKQHDKMVAGIKRGRTTKESKAKTSQQAKAQWSDPEYAAKQSVNNREIASRPEVKAAKAAALKARWNDPVQREKLLAARNKKPSLDPPPQQA